MPWKGQRGGGRSWEQLGDAELWDEPSQISFRRREKHIGTHSSGGLGLAFERLASSDAVDRSGAAEEKAC